MIQLRSVKIARMTQLFAWDRIEREQLSPTFARQVIHGDMLTVARVFLSKGCSVPLHSHHNEQISIIESGALKFVIDGEEKIVRAGEILRIPAHVPHSAEAEEDVAGIDIFCPVREDWRRGDDAYLRK
jgi:quercetin dioxygenase-like cupin family protein